MQLSILIPLYNAENYILRCLNSIMTQSLLESEFEVVIINDGSTDNSYKIVEDYAMNYKNIILYSHKNQGAYPTRNRLLELAKGTYVYFIDADDYLAHNSIKDILDYALQNKLDVMGFSVLVTNEAEVFNTEKLFKQFDLPKIISGAQFLKENKNLQLEIWWYLIRKDFLDTSAITFSKIALADVIFTLQLFLNAKNMAYSPVSIYRYFQSAESTMRSKDSKSKNRIIDNFEELIVKFSHLINSLNDYKVLNINDIQRNFMHRRDVFIFFTIIKMIKAKLSLKTIKKKLKVFKNVNAYPIKLINNEEYNTYKYKILVALINNQSILYSIVQANNLFAKKNKK